MRAPILQSLPLTLSLTQVFFPCQALADNVVAPIVPTDLTNVPLIQGVPLGPVSMPKLNPGAAVMRLSESSFPTAEQAKDTDSGIIIVGQKGADMQRTSTTSVQLTSGTVFVSVRKPANLAFVTTPHGEVCVASEGAVLVIFDDGLLRVLNLNAFGDRVKVKIHQAAVSAKIVGTGAGNSTASAAASGSAAASDSAASTERFAMAIKIGHELIATDRPLTRDDLTPADGIARRRSAVFENDRMAVSEFSLESVLTKSDVLVSLDNEKATPPERRVLRGLAKMASVLNYVDGQGGFVARGKHQ